jgi:hypothetical protein
MADGSGVLCDLVGPVEVRFGNQSTNCNAYVLPGNNEPFLGAIPMEGLDSIIHPKRQELVVNCERRGAAFLSIKRFGLLIRA